MTDTISETDIIEKLNSSTTVRGFFIATGEIFNQSIDTLIQRVFRKDDFAVQSVVGPLLDNSGPLGDLSVRLKLLFGLGVLPDEIYHDIEDIISLKNALTHSANEYDFFDPYILQPMKKLRSADHMGIVQSVIPPSDDLDAEFYQLQLQRQRQIIKSALSLTVVHICGQLDRESPL
ncbi:MltR family transcriptional regulator [Vibrio sp. MACH09]|uniref:MltR family transcriptional regulator n=1 Tax=unclassified Vibrio TaxID=2614977 RepID=UPI00149396A6|nr:MULTISPECIES: MltR family transcriptional regulator [unclassified Vibrio]NOI67916.1 MltR family transcriptional regulator [Vibrio sp. 99-8-1]GLO61096.1 MltR family transcriptional regulator [Vibrio sp. MACH09]